MMFITKKRHVFEMRRLADETNSQRLDLDRQLACERAQLVCERAVRADVTASREGYRSDLHRAIIQLNALDGIHAYVLQELDATRQALDEEKKKNDGLIQALEQQDDLIEELDGLVEVLDDALGLVVDECGECRCGKNTGKKKGKAK